MISLQTRHAVAVHSKPVQRFRGQQPEEPQSAAPAQKQSGKFWSKLKGKSKWAVIGVLAFYTVKGLAVTALGVFLGAKGCQFMTDKPDSQPPSLSAPAEPKQEAPVKDKSTQK